LLKLGGIDCIVALNDFCDPLDHEASQRGFASAPASWYYVGNKSELAHGPSRFELPGGQRYVAFPASGGSVSVLGARCSHMNADLASGCVRDGRIVCPLHGWEYAGDGHCVRIPATPNVPAFARQPSFPVAECGGLIYFFNRPEARFPLPFFPGRSQTELLAAEPFEFDVDVPWYLVGANGFDVQHFNCAHDRTLLGEPVIDSPHPFAWRMKATFRVTGHSSSIVSPAGSQVPRWR
jgi:phenylpropionate dioxygenase-like ring-hydroxylating dioxygenase large terminal subunit